MTPPQPPPDTPFDMSAPPPPGYRWELHPAGPDWSLAEGSERKRKCRHPGCQQGAVAAINRSFRPGRRLWWFYCADHLYGRVIVDGIVMCRRAVPVEGAP